MIARGRPLRLHAMNRRSDLHTTRATDTPDRAASARAVEIPVGEAVLHGDLCFPAGPRAIVIFAHGSGSSRFSRRNQHVAARFQEHGLGTLLFDLLTAREEQIDAWTRQYRFDIPLLAGRLIAATTWIIETQPELTRVGLFGASTGAAAALVAAARLCASVFAVVSRGGRPDLAAAALEQVTAPTRLIVGGNDPEVLALNEAALRHLHCAKDLIVIPGATHLFEEPGALDAVAEHAAQWFTSHLASAA